MNSKFFNMKNTGLCSWIVKSCERKNIIHATSIQQTIIPIIISRKDSLLFSRTGTGKTLSFILPLLHIHYLNPQNCFINVIVPTKELGVQIYQTYNILGQEKRIIGIFIGKNITGHNFKKKIGTCLISTINSLSKIYEHFDKLFVCKLKIFVLDEIDILMNFTNFGLIKKIFLGLKPSQTNMFGVTNITFFKYLKNFSYQRKIFFFDEKQKKFNLFSEIKHEYIYCLSKFKFKFLVAILKLKEKNEKTEIQKIPTLIFLKNRKNCEKLIQALREQKITAGILHHEMDFFQRTVSTQLLKRGIIDILVSTDLGSRGINFSSVNLVINLDMPKKIDTYLHRTGRIGRFNRKGYCLNLIDKNEIDIIHIIEKNLGINVNKSNLDFKKIHFKKIY